MSTITTRAGKGSPLTNAEVDANFTNLNTDKAELSGAAFTGAITTTSTVDGRDVATDGTKLDGIEASADVTDTTNVTAAGALMDSEVTNLAQVKAFDSSDYATAAQGTTADAALPKSGGAMTGAITTNSTFDGRDVATDGTKLDGIEASADVTDTANVTAAGALMDSELTSIASVKALNQGVATTDSPTFAAVTANGGVVVDNFTLDGTTLALSSGDMTLDAAGRIDLSADDSGEIRFFDGSSMYGQIKDDDDRLKIQGLISNKAMLLVGNDGGSEVTMLSLDAENAGAATFNAGATFNGTATMDGLTVDGDAIIKSGGVNNTPADLSLWHTDVSIVSGDDLAVISAEGSDSGGSAPYQGAKILFDAAANWDTGSSNYYPTNIKFFTQDNSGTDTIAAGPRMTISSAGNALVGRTSSLSGQSGSVSANTVLSAHGGLSAHATSAGILEHHNDETILRSYGANAGSGKLVFKVGGGGGSADSEAMRIDSSGNVGIGTSAIMQDFGSGRTTLALKGAGSTDYSTLQLGNYGTSSNGQIHGLINFYDGTTSVSRIQSVRASNTSDANLAFYTAPSSGGITERMRIDSSGDLIKVGGVIKGERGTASAPAYSFSDDTDTGMFNIANADLGFAVGGSERMRIDSSGRLGLGITPSATTAFTVLQNKYLSLYGYDAAQSHIVTNTYYPVDNGVYKRQASGYAQKLTMVNGSYIFNTAASGAADSDITFSPAMTLDASGNLLVGTTSTADTDVGGKIFSDGRMVQGIAGVGLADMHDFYRGTAGSLTRVGNIRTNGSSTTYNTSSDQRLKDNIVDAPSASDDIDAIQVRSFDWKADGSHQKYGMVAQELNTVAPEAVSGDADSEDMMGVDYSKLVPMLIKEIQSLRNRVAQLEE